MDADHFNTLARSLTATSRRRVLGMLSAVGLSTLMPLLPLADEAAARRKKKKKKKKKSGTTATTTAPPPAPSGCPAGQRTCPDGRCVPGNGCCASTECGEGFCCPSSDVCHPGICVSSGFECGSERGAANCDCTCCGGFDGTPQNGVCL